MLRSPSSLSYGTFTRAKTAHVAYLKHAFPLLAYVVRGHLEGVEACSAWCGRVLCMVWMGVLHGVEGCFAGCGRVLCRVWMGALHGV